MPFELPITQLTTEQERPKIEKTAKEILTTEVKDAYVRFDPESKQEKQPSQEIKPAYTQTRILDSFFPESDGDQSRSKRNALEGILQALHIDTLDASVIENPIIRASLTELSNDYLKIRLVASSQMNSDLSKIVEKAKFLLKPPVDAKLQTLQ